MGAIPNQTEKAGISVVLEFEPIIVVSRSFFTDSTVQRE